MVVSLAAIAMLLVGASHDAGSAGSREPVTPSVPMKPAFANLAGTAANGVDLRWWSTFGDPALDALIETALEQNFTIAEAVSRLDRARAGIRAADGARLPALAANADAAYVRLSEEDPQLGPVTRFPGFQRNQDRYSATLGASWELDLFGRLGERSREARADAMATAAEVDAARLAVTTEIADRYINLRLLQQRRIVATARADALSDLARLSTLRVERGVSPRIEGDRLLAEAQSAAVAVPALTAAIEAQYARIDVLAGRAVGSARSELDTPANLPDSPRIDLGATPADLLRRRPDIIAAEARLASRDAGVAAALRDRLPRFNLAGLIGTIAGAINPLFGAAAFTAQGTAGFSYSIFDGGRSRASVDAARADLATASSSYQTTVLGAIADVEAASAARVSAEARTGFLRAAEQRLEAANRAVRVGEAQGALSLNDVLDVDRRLQDARDARLLAEADRALASIALVRALGGSGPTVGSGDLSTQRVW